MTSSERAHLHSVSTVDHRPDQLWTEFSRVMGYTDTPSITLISCGGVWDPSAGTHDKRVAVRGELVKAA